MSLHRFLAQITTMQEGQRKRGYQTTENRVTIFVDNHENFRIMCLKYFLKTLS